MEVVDNNIIKKLAYRLVKRHIAGFNMEAVLDMVRKLNQKGFSATITFLNEHVNDRVKAKYNANAYVQLLRQLSRLHLNAGISLRLSQLGYGISEEDGMRNLEEIIDAAKNTSKLVWMENTNGINMQKIYNWTKARYNGVGIEVPIGYNAQKGCRLKIRYHIQHMLSDSKIEKNPKSERRLMQEFGEKIAKISEKAESLVVLEKKPDIIEKLSSISKGKRNLIFELPLGYEKKLEKARRMQNMSIYVPYGRDWVPYIISSIAEGKIKKVATTLLDGEKYEGGKSNAQWQ